MSISHEGENCTREMMRKYSIYSTHPDGSSEERGRVGIRLNVVMPVIVMVMVAVACVGRTSAGCLLRLDRHSRSGLSFPLAKPVPVHAETELHRHLLVYACFRYVCHFESWYFLIIYTYFEITSSTTTMLQRIECFQLTQTARKRPLHCNSPYKTSPAASPHVTEKQLKRCS